MMASCDEELSIPPLIMMIVWHFIQMMATCEKELGHVRLAQQLILHCGEQPESDREEQVGAVCEKEIPEIGRQLRFHIWW